MCLMGIHAGVAAEQFKIAIYDDFAPFHYVNQEGKPEGALVDLWTQWALLYGHEIEFVIVKPKDVNRLLKRGKISFIAGEPHSVSLDEDREQGDALFPVYYSIYLHKDLIGINKLNQLSPLQIGITTSTLNSELVQSLPERQSIRQFPTRSTLHHAALQRDILAFLEMDLRQTDPLWLKLTRNFPISKRLAVQADYISFSVKKGDFTRQKWLNNQLRAIPKELQKQIESKWFTKGQEGKSLILAVSKDNLPYMTSASDGEAIGLFVDIWKAWSRVTGIPVSFIPFLEEDAVNAIKDERADIHIAIHEEVVEGIGLKPTEHTYSLFYRLFINQESGIHTAQELANRRIGVIKTSPFLPEIRQTIPDVQLVYYTSYIHMIESTIAGEITGFIGPTNLTEYLLFQGHLQQRFRVMESPKYETRLFAVVDPKNEKLAAEIKSGFERLSIRELSTIERRWIPNPKHRYFSEENIKFHLTQSELDWLEAHPKIRLGVMSNWPPYEYFNAKGDFDGITLEFSKLLESKLEAEFEILTYDSWQALLQAMEQKEVDMIFNTSPSRTEPFLSFTQPYWEAPDAMLTKAEGSTYSRLENLSGEKVAVVRNFAVEEYLRHQFPEIELYQVESLKEGIKAVDKEIVVGFIENLEALAFLIRKHQYVGFDLSIPEDMETKQNAIAVRRDWPEFRSIVDKLLSSIPEDDIRQIYKRWKQVRIEQGYSIERVLEVGLQAGGVIVVIFWIILYWNRRLHREISLRREVEEKMKHIATHDDLTGLPNRVLLRDRLEQAVGIHARGKQTLALCFIDLDGFKFVNDTYGHDVGDELLIEVAERIKTTIRKSDTVARFGGDEFVLLLANVGYRREVEQIVSKVLETVKEPYQLSTCESIIGASIGIAMFPEDGRDATELLKVADTLMYKVKASGKNCYRFND